MQKENDKLKRLRTIKDLVSLHKISNQEELLSFLLRKGFNLTQATLSRDLRTLKISKAPDNRGVYHYVLPKEFDNSASSPVLNDKEKINKGGVSIEFGGQFAILKTRPGYANAIAGDIDAHGIPQIMGTIAGDDTVLLILRNENNKNQLFEELSELIPLLFKV